MKRGELTKEDIREMIETINNSYECGEDYILNYRITKDCRHGITMDEFPYSKVVMMLICFYSDYFEFNEHFLNNLHKISVLLLNSDERVILYSGLCLLMNDVPGWNCKKFL